MGENGEQKTGKMESFPSRKAATGIRQRMHSLRTYPAREATETPPNVTGAPPEVKARGRSDEEDARVREQLFAGVNREVVAEMRDKANRIIQARTDAQLYAMGSKIMDISSGIQNLNELIPLMQQLPDRPKRGREYSDDDVALAYAFLSLSE